MTRTPDCADVTPDGRVHFHHPDDDCLDEEGLRYMDRGTHERPEEFRVRVEREAARASGRASAFDCEEPENRFEDPRWSDYGRS